MEQQETIKEVGINSILEIMPHRYPFLLVDKVKDICPDVSGTGIKNVTINEPFFQGHFPNNPIVPGVLQIEAMAQTACIVVLMGFSEEERKNNSVYFMTVEGVKFRKPIIPGDVIEFKVKKEQTLRNVYKFKGEGYVDGKLVTQATFSAMIVKARQ